MSISPQFLDELRNRISISEIVGRRVKLIRAGREFKGCCPFHNEKTPSFYVNDQKQFYHCFGCGAHGDILKFTMEQGNLGFRDAVEMLAGQAGMQVPAEDPRQVEKAQKAKSLHEMMAQAARWYAAQLTRPENSDVQGYLSGRGISQETIAYFQIGYAPDSAAELIRYLEEQGYTLKDMGEAGLIRKSAKNNEPYPFFRDRVMFPVLDRRGRIVAFGGRTLPDHIRPPNPNSSFTPPKYLNSSDTVLFDKGRMLYGEDKARLAARDGKPVIVTEGYMDVIACHAAGLTGAVAPMGTAMTEAQIQSLWMMIPAEYKEPILCFDGDNAGRKAAERACERILPLLKAGHTIRLAFMPAGEDPDSLIKSGGVAKINAVLKAAMPLVDYLWYIKTVGRDVTTPESRASVIKSLKDEIARIEDRDVQIHYKSLIDQRISDQFFGHYNQRGKNSKTGGKFDKSALRPSLVRPAIPNFNDLYEKILIAVLINHPAIFDYVEELLGAMRCTQIGIGQLKETVVSTLGHDPDLSRQDLLEKLLASPCEKEVRDILHENIYVHAAFAAPFADSQEDGDLMEVVKKWREIWESLQERRNRSERTLSWKQALHGLDEDSEKKLSAMIEVGKSG
jgi:DNA primase